MGTQGKTFGTVAASAVIGIVIAVVVAVCAIAFGGVALFSSPQNGGEGAYLANVEMHEVTDCAGRTVQVPVTPRHIAAMDSFSGDVCVLAGAGERMMGAPGGVLSNALLQRVYPDLASLQQLSGNSINAEEMLASGVDVVFVKDELYQGGNEVAKLESLGIPYVVIGYATVEEQIGAIGVIAQVIGGQAQERADSLQAYYRDVVELVETRAANIPESQRRSVYHSINDALLTDGSGSLGSDWITRTGAVDVSSQSQGKAGSGDYTATIEQVYAWDPDVVICNSLDAADDMRSSAQWQGLPAVSAGEVYNIPVSASRWGQRGDPETFLAMLWLGKTLYPDQYADVDLKQTVVTYYRDILGIEIDNETWDQIIAGEGIRVQGNGGNGDGM